MDISVINYPHGKHSCASRTSWALIWWVLSGFLPQPIDMQLVGSGFAGDSKLVVGFSVLALHKQSESKTIYTERWQVLDLIEYIYHLYTSGNVML